jgi:phosphofructokinase-like protein
MARIGVLTGGGDCPGLNAVIRAVVRKGLQDGHTLFGYKYGWAGVLEGDGDELTVERTAGILPRGGTILGSSRTNPFKKDGPGVDGVRAGMERHGVDVLVPIGGEDTLGVAARLAEAGIPVVGVPKTIDNDLKGTEAVDRLHTTAESHNRVMVLEVMGRHAGFIAAHAGMAGGGDVILVPERPFDIEEVCDHIRRRHHAGRTFSIVVVSEGATPKEGTLSTTGAEGKLDAFGHERLGGIAVTLESEIEARTGYETRMTILGHVQRGGTPTAFDRVLATRFGVAAAEAVTAGTSGKMVALRGTDIVTVPISEALGDPKTLDDKFFQDAAVFFG